MSITFIDTHAHLDDPQFPDLPEVLERTRAQGVERVINIGYGPERWDSTLALAATYPMISPVLGIHPLDAHEFNPESFARLRSLIEQHRPVAIGEAGIDLFRQAPPIEIQRDAFAAQIALAIETSLPLVIHQRAAEDEVYSMLAGSDESLHVILHSFDGTARMVEPGIERGWYFGVGGLMTKQSSQPLRDVLKTIPLERIVLETDSPYLVPAGVKPRRNSPANIPAIATHLAALTGRSITEIAEITTRNAFAAFPGLTATTALGSAR
jgi:TatD DNase family protein